jgi:hypothetical protein
LRCVTAHLLLKKLVTLRLRLLGDVRVKPAMPASRNGGRAKMFARG